MFWEAKKKLGEGTLHWLTDTWKCAFIGFGGATNGLDASDAATTVAGISGAATYQFNGSGYTAGGMTLAGKTIIPVTTTNIASFDADDVVINPMGAGSGNGAQITDLLVYKDVGGVYANGIPFLRINLNATYTGQNA